MLNFEDKINVIIESIVNKAFFKFRDEVKDMIENETIANNNILRGDVKDMLREMQIEIEKIRENTKMNSQYLLQEKIVERVKTLEERLSLDVEPIKNITDELFSVFLLKSEWLELLEFIDPTLSYLQQPPIIKKIISILHRLKN